MPPKKTKSEKIIDLKKFNMASIKPNKKILFIGGTNTGKSVLIKDYLYYHQSEFPIVTLISPTEPYNKTFKNHVPAIFIHEQFSEELVEQLINRQKKISKDCEDDPSYINVNPCTAIIMDDCLADIKLWKNDPNIKWIFENGRHANITLLMSMQYAVGIPPVLRANIQYVFLCKNTKIQEQKKLYDMYAGMFESFSQFRDTFKKCTQRFGCMVINNEAPSYEIEENVFFYRATVDDKPDLKTFRLCYPIFWKDNDKCARIKQQELEKVRKLTPNEKTKKIVVSNDDSDDE